MYGKSILLMPGFLCLCLFVRAQDTDRPAIASGILSDPLTLDGMLDEPQWQHAPVLTGLLTVEPEEGATPSALTNIRVLANARNVVFGIRCEDSSPEDIVRFSKLRDAALADEDHVRIVIDPFLDGQSGYILAVNANGARYDALVSNRGEAENDEWDTVWEAATTIDEEGWTVEIRLPIQSINFKKGLTTWGFNVERRIQRNQETIRWANAKRDQWFIQTSRSGLLTHLPGFSYGAGLTIRPALVSGIAKSGAGGITEYSLEPSLDISQRLSPNVLATVTLNTDFAETEVDSRQTNLTRFPLFFPEKRSFFLEGADIFEFGLGTGSGTLLPFFSRRIGLHKGNAIPVHGGAKLNGRIGKTAFGGLVTATGAYTSPEDTLSGSTQGVIRVRQNLLRESSFGMLASFGDPLSRSGSWMSGADLTFQTTRFQGDKNFLVGVWGLYTDREDLGNDGSAFGIKVDYPNDLWDIVAMYQRIGDDFDPSLGFVPRRGIHYLRAGLTYAPRPKWSFLRQMFNQAYLTWIGGTDGEWESYLISLAPVSWLFESGDQIELILSPQGENLDEPFAIEDDVIITPGPYHFMRISAGVETAAKRRVGGEVVCGLGSFYDGNLSTIDAILHLNPSAFINMEFGVTRNEGRLPAGDFNQTLLAFLLRLNVTPDLQFNSYIQYDTESRDLGFNIRAHWIFSPLGDAFLVFNHNTLDKSGEGWTLQSRQILAKVRYNIRL